MNRDHSVLRLHPSTCISDSFVDYDDYSMSSEGFLLTIVDKWSSELNSPIPVHFSSLIPKMLTFTLAISCLTTSNLPWFMDLRFQVPMQYCSLQHRNLLPSPVIHNWVLFLLWLHLFFLELFLHWSPVACWAPIDLGSSSFSVLSFCLFILFMGFLRQECWSGLPFPSDHVWSQLSTMAHPSRDPDFEGLETVGYESRPVSKPVCGSVSLCVK